MALGSCIFRKCLLLIVLKAFAIDEISCQNDGETGRGSSTNIWDKLMGIIKHSPDASTEIRSFVSNKQLDSIGRQERSCTIPCENEGLCVGRDVCRCIKGWYGATCTLFECSEACLNGVCRGPDTCFCDSGWTGNTCSKPICNPSCMNSGKCIGPNECQCADGYVGNRCQDATCDPPCGQGNCYKPNQCTCDPGWQGPLCTQPSCTPSCENGGECARPNQCSCSAEWRGYFCEIPVCKNRCQNGGTCVAPNECNCPPKFVGDFCEVALDREAHVGRTCTVWSAYHFRTYDGHAFDFPGLCRYELTKDVRDGFFSVELIKNGGDFTGEHEHEDDHEVPEPVAEMVRNYTGEFMALALSIRGSESSFTLLPNRLYMVENQLISDRQYSYRGVSIETIGRYLRVKTRFGLSILWDGEGVADIEMENDQYRGGLGGLCGNFDSDPYNDRVMRDGSPADPFFFAMAWRVNGIHEACTDITEIPDPCTGVSPENSEENQYTCQILMSNMASFRYCRDRGLDPTSFIDACVRDICKCKIENKVECTCNALTQYSRLCAHETGIAPKWRTPDLCGVNCPAGMVYDECASSCPRTCQSLVTPETDCDEHCMDGCTCVNGTVLRKDNVCVPEEECPCVHGDQLYPPGHVIKQNCLECECTGAMWNCKTLQCPGECSVVGASHYTTFDGMLSKIYGECQFTFVKDCSETDLFSVLVENSLCGNDLSQTCVNDVLIVLRPISSSPSSSRTTNGDHEIQIRLGRNGRVAVGDQSVLLPSLGEHYQIFQTSSEFVQVKLNLGVELEWNGNSRLYVKAERKWMGKLCGMCGNFNENKKDDMMNFNGLVEKSATAFSNLWKVNADCREASSELNLDACVANPEKAQFAKEKCSVIRENAFKKCHPFVDPEEAETTCRQDVCGCDEGASCLCHIVAHYARQCTKKGIIVNWRTEEFCPYICTGGQTHQQCGSSCLNTCRSISDPQARCSETCVEGCNCPPDMFLNEYKVCVKRAQCQCYHNGNVYQPFYILRREFTVCHCRDGLFTCQNSEINSKSSLNIAVHNASDCKPGWIYHTCGDAGDILDSYPQGIECQKTCKNLDSRCFATECVEGCGCSEGLVLDTESNSCIERDQCPCYYGGQAHYPGEVVKVDCNTCKCQNRGWVCTEEPCVGTCVAYGDPHFQTFDGYKYDFMGQCGYILTQDYCGNHEGTFRVIVENSQCGSDGVSCAKAVTVTLTGNIYIKMTKDSFGYEKRDLVTWGVLHGSPSNSTSVLWDFYNVGLFTIVTTNIGLTVVWDGKSTLYVKLHPRYKGRVCGLCGDFDDNQNNDIMMSDHMPSVNPTEFGNSWKVSAACTDAVEQESQCSKHPQRRLWAQRNCKILYDDVFAVCHSVVDVVWYHANCVFDACSCDNGGDCECLCTAIAAYAHACAEEGVKIRWRTDKVCPLMCEAYDEHVGDCTWHYHECNSVCPGTCQRSLSSDEFNPCPPSVSCVEGCFPTCPEGQLYEEESRSCVSACRSGCHVNAKYYGYGEIVAEEPGKICTCEHPRTIVCTPTAVNISTTALETTVATRAAIITTTREQTSGPGATTKPLTTVRITSALTTPMEDVKSWTVMQRYCSGEVNLGFLLDCTHFISAEEFELVKDMLTQMVHSIMPHNYGKQNATLKIGIGLYGEEYEEAMAFESEQNISSLHATVTDLELQNSEHGKISLALVKMVENFENRIEEQKNEHLVKLENVAFIIMFSQPDDDFVRHINALHDIGVKVLILSAGNGPSKERLEQLVGDLALSHHVSLINHFMEDTELGLKVLDEICDGETHPKPTLTTTAPVVSMTTEQMTTTTSVMVPDEICTMKADLVVIIDSQLLRESEEENKRFLFLLKSVFSETLVRQDRTHVTILLSDARVWRVKRFISNRERLLGEFEEALRTISHSRISSSSRFDLNFALDSALYGYLLNERSGVRSDLNVHKSISVFHERPPYFPDPESRISFSDKLESIKQKGIVLNIITQKHSFDSRREERYWRSTIGTRNLLFTYLNRVDLTQTRLNRLMQRVCRTPPNLPIEKKLCAGRNDIYFLWDDSDNIASEDLKNMMKATRKISNSLKTVNFGISEQVPVRISIAQFSNYVDFLIDIQDQMLLQSFIKAPGWSVPRWSVGQRSNLGSALGEVIDRFDGLTISRNKTVVIFTSRTSSDNLEEVLRKLDSLGAKRVVIGFAPDTNVLELKKIAGESGFYRRIASARELLDNDLSIAITDEICIPGEPLLYTPKPTAETSSKSTRSTKATTAAQPTTQARTFPTPACSMSSDLLIIVDSRLTSENTLSNHTISIMEQIIKDLEIGDQPQTTRVGIMVVGQKPTIVADIANQGSNKGHLLHLLNKLSDLVGSQSHSPFSLVKAIQMANDFVFPSEEKERKSQRDILLITDRLPENEINEFLENSLDSVKVVIDGMIEEDFNVYMLYTENTFVMLSKQETRNWMVNLRERSFYLEETDNPVHLGSEIVDTICSVPTRVTTSEVPFTDTIRPTISSSESPKTKSTTTVAVVPTAAGNATSRVPTSTSAGIRPTSPPSTPHRTEASSIKTSTVTREFTIEPTSIPVVEECQMDLGIIVDSSYSLQPVFHLIKKFLNSLIDDMDIENDVVRVGLIQYGAEVKLEFDLIDFAANSTGMKNAIEELTLLQGTTNTFNAIEYLLDNMLSADVGRREDVPVVILLLTDGRIKDVEKKERVMRKLLMRKLSPDNPGLTMMVIGFGSVDHEELLEIADAARYLEKAELFDREDFTKNISSSLCTLKPQERRTTTKTPSFPTTTPATACGGMPPTDVLFVLDGSVDILRQRIVENYREFLAQMVQKFDIGDQKTRVGVSLYSEEVYNEFPKGFGLGKFPDVAGLLEAVTNLELTSRMAFDSVVSLSKILAEHFPSRRGDRRVAVVLLTELAQDSLDGKSLEDVFREATDQGIEIVLVIASNIPGMNEEIASTAGSVIDKSNKILINGGLQGLPTAEKQLEDAICKELPKQTAALTTTLRVEVTSATSEIPQTPLEIASSTTIAKKGATSTLVKSTTSPPTLVTSPSTSKASATTKPIFAKVSGSTTAETRTKELLTSSTKPLSPVTQRTSTTAVPTSSSTTSSRSPLIPSTEETTAAKPSSTLVSTTSRTRSTTSPISSITTAHVLEPCPVVSDALLVVDENIFSEPLGAESLISYLLTIESGVNLHYTFAHLGVLTAPSMDILKPIRVSDQLASDTIEANAEKYNKSAKQDIDIGLVMDEAMDFLDKTAPREIEKRHLILILSTDVVGTITATRWARMHKLAVSMVVISIHSKFLQSGAPEVIPFYRIPVSSVGYLPRAAMSTVKDICAPLSTTPSITTKAPPQLICPPGDVVILYDAAFLNPDSEHKVKEFLGKLVDLLSKTYSHTRTRFSLVTIGNAPEQHFTFSATRSPAQVNRLIDESFHAGAADRMNAATALNFVMQRVFNTNVQPDNQRNVTKTLIMLMARHSSEDLIPVVKAMRRKVDLITLAVGYTEGNLEEYTTVPHGGVPVLNVEHLTYLEYETLELICQVVPEFTTTPIPTSVPVTRPRIPCKVDVLFMLDEKLLASVRSVAATKQFIDRIASNLVLDSEYFEINVNKFSEESSGLLGNGFIDNLGSLQQDLDANLSVSPVTGSLSLGSGLEYAVGEFSTTGRDGDDVARVVIFVLRRIPIDTPDVARMNELRNDGITVFSVVIDDALTIPRSSPITNFKRGFIKAYRPQYLPNFAALIVYYLWNAVCFKQPTVIPPESTAASTSPPLPGVCYRVMDVAFIVDAELVANEYEKESVQYFIKDIVRAFDLGPQATRISLVKYGSVAHPVISLRSAYDIKTAFDAIDSKLERMNSYRQLSSKTFVTSTLLHTARNILKSEDVRDVEKFIVLIVKNRFSDEMSDLRGVAGILKRLNIKTLTLVPPTIPSEQTAALDPDELFTYNTADDLLSHRFGVVEVLCGRERPPEPTTTSTKEIQMTQQTKVTSPASATTTVLTSRAASRASTGRPDTGKTLPATTTGFIEEKVTLPVETTPLLRLERNCSKLKLDLKIMLQASDYFAKFGHQQLLMFVNSLSKYFDLGEDAVLISLSQFSSDLIADHEHDGFDFNGKFNSNMRMLLRDAIFATHVHMGNDSNPALALDTVIESQLPASKGARDGVRKAILFVMDGLTKTDAIYEFNQAIHKALKRRHSIFIVGVPEGKGDVENTEDFLKAIYEIPTKNKVFVKHGFSEPWTKTMISNLGEEICKDVPQPLTLITTTKATTKPPVPMTTGYVATTSLRSKPVKESTITIAIPPEVCAFDVNLEFVIDVTNLGYHNLAILKEFLLVLLERFEISENSTNVAIIRYGSSPYTTWNFTQPQSFSSIWTEIGNIVSSGKITNTGSALLLASELIQQAPSDVGSVVTLITNARSKDDMRDGVMRLKEVQSTHEAGMKLVAVGLESSSPEQLAYYADDNSIVQVDNFDNLLATETVNKVFELLCEPYIRSTVSTSTSPATSRESSTPLVRMTTISSTESTEVCVCEWSVPTSRHTPSVESPGDDESWVFASPSDLCQSGYSAFNVECSSSGGYIQSNVECSLAKPSPICHNFEVINGSECFNYMVSVKCCSPSCGEPPKYPPVHKDMRCNEPMDIVYVIDSTTTGGTLQKVKQFAGRISEDMKFSPEKTRAAIVTYGSGDSVFTANWTDAIEQMKVSLDSITKSPNGTSDVAKALKVVIEELSRIRRTDHTSEDIYKSVVVFVSGSTVGVVDGLISQLESANFQIIVVGLENPRQNVIRRLAKRPELVFTPESMDEFLSRTSEDVLSALCGPPATSTSTATTEILVVSEQTTSTSGVLLSTTQQVTPTASSTTSSTPSQTAKAIPSVTSETTTVPMASPISISTERITSQPETSGKLTPVSRKSTAVPSIPTTYQEDIIPRSPVRDTTTVPRHPLTTSVGNTTKQPKTPELTTIVSEKTERMTTKRLAPEESSPISQKSTPVPTKTPAPGTGRPVVSTTEVVPPKTPNATSPLSTISTKRTTTEPKTPKKITPSSQKSTTVSPKTTTLETHVPVVPANLTRTTVPIEVTAGPHILSTKETTAQPKTQEAVTSILTKTTTIVTKTSISEIPEAKVTTKAKDHITPGVTQMQSSVPELPFVPGVFTTEVKQFTEVTTPPREVTEITKAISPELVTSTQPITIPPEVTEIVRSTSTSTRQKLTKTSITPQTPEEKTTSAEEVTYPPTTIGRTSTTSSAPTTTLPRCHYIDQKTGAAMLLEVDQIIYPRKEDACYSLRCDASGKVLLENKRLACERLPKPKCRSQFEPVLRYDDSCNCQWECQCYCQASSSIVHTFDGRMYPVDVDCEHTVVQSSNRAAESGRRFSVSITKTPCGVLRCIAELTLSYDGEQVTLYRNFSTRPNNIEHTIGGNIKLDIVGSHKFLLSVEEIGLDIEFKPTSNFVGVSLSGYLWDDDTEGLCGTCNDNREDDFKLKSGEITSDITVFVKDWTRDDECNVTERVPCEARGDSLCEAIKSSKAFEECRSKIDWERYYYYCVTETCEQSGRECDSITAFAEACRHAEICVDWRSEDLCPVECSDGRIFKSCQRPPYEKSCSESPPQSGLSGLSEGCFLECGENRTVINDKCMSVENCFKCFDEGSRTFKTPGEIWTPPENKCRTCVCTEKDLVVKCEDKTCTTETARPTCDECQKISLKANSDPCCPEYECVCDYLNCDLVIPDRPCDDGALWGLVSEPGSCRPAYNCTCELDQCEVETISCEPPRVPKEVSTSCCPKQQCACLEACEDVAIQCEVGFSRRVHTDVCNCSTYTCEPMPVCVVRYNNQSMIKTYGERWTDGENPCLDCTCNRISENSHNVSCTDQSNSCTSCQEGFRPDAVPGTCCPQCVQDSCIIVDKENATIVRRIDDTWQSDECTVSRCILKQGRPVVTTTPAVECKQPSQETCKFGYKLQCTDNPCCLDCSCIPQDVCLYNGSVSQSPGNSWTVDACTSCDCTFEKDENGFNSIKCTTVKCDACKKGFKLHPINGTCCGECVPTECEVRLIGGDDDARKVLQMGEDLRDGCHVYHCVENDKGSAVLGKVNVTCSAFNQDECLRQGGSIGSDDSGCCPTCKFQERECQLHMGVPMNISQGGCVTDQEITTPYCEGQCGSSVHFDYSSGQFAHACTCCKPVAYENKTAEATCADGSKTQLPYRSVTGCSCSRVACTEWTVQTESGEVLSFKSRGGEESSTVVMSSWTSDSSISVVEVTDVDPSHDVDAVSVLQQTISKYGLENVAFQVLEMSAKNSTLGETLMKVFNGKGPN